MVTPNDKEEPRLRSILPPQPEDYPFMTGADLAMRRALDIDIHLADWVDIDTVDRMMLPYIGSLVGADLHTTALGDEYERTTVKDAWLYHKLRGTQAAIDRLAHNAKFAWDYEIRYADGTRKPTGVIVHLFQQRAAEFSESQLHYLCRAIERLLPVHGVVRCDLQQIYSGEANVYGGLLVRHYIDFEG